MYRGRLAVVFTSVQQRRVLKEFYFLGFFPDKNRVNSLWILRARLISPAGNLLIKFWLTFFARPCGRNVVSNQYTIVGVFLIQRRRARISPGGWRTRQWRAIRPLCDSRGIYRGHRKTSIQPSVFAANASTSSPSQRNIVRAVRRHDAFAPARANDPVLYPFLIILLATIFAV